MSHFSVRTLSGYIALTRDFFHSETSSIQAHNILSLLPSSEYINGSESEASICHATTDIILRRICRMYRLKSVHRSRRRIPRYGPVARTKRQERRREQKYQSAMGILHFFDIEHSERGTMWAKMCVCMWERGREGERAQEEKKRERDTTGYSINLHRKSI